ncbi:SDR family NAD(P)-dependent oxidoreductase [Trujillonella humicola]|uniref:SDR family NAD(P)-dependent oxidoreductase n=1 Tax=Trujillonella humicola TaxID=3383699 RepID=UPI003905D8FA
MDLGLAGRRAVISGGSHGIGRAVAARLLREGASVAICARDEKGVAAAVEELGDLGTIVGHACDVADEQAVRRWVDAAAEALGGIDVVVSNASASGQHGDGAAPWQTNFTVDVLGCVALCEASKPHLDRSDAAAIVQIGTITAIEHHDVPINPSYGAMKAATINYMAQLAQRWGPDGIRANTVSPGPILIEGRKWDDLRERRPEIYARDRDRHPTRRMGTADEVAAIVAVLASPAASWVNGENVVVDGGYTKRVGF